ncbi:hypothetical protein OUZ56_001612 [Daphnia magna]|uniref:Uncharacterized protein n=1 Tax=Daphnia magna TaxID=35525 RepID=A0ABR0A3Q8_9CRUS|nr:hypothetical protein OUZ56_001612 [Daphnia magna]
MRDIYQLYPQYWRFSIKDTHTCAAFYYPVKSAGGPHSHHRRLEMMASLKSIARVEPMKLFLNRDTDKSSNMFMCFIPTIESNRWFPNTAACLASSHCLPRFLPVVKEAVRDVRFASMEWQKSKMNVSPINLLPVLTDFLFISCIFTR